MRSMTSGSSRDDQGRFSRLRMLLFMLIDLPESLLELLAQRSANERPRRTVMPRLQNAIAQQHPQEEAKDQTSDEELDGHTLTPLPMLCCIKTYASPYTGGRSATALPGRMRPRL